MPNYDDNGQLIRKGTALSNLYVNFNDQTKSTFTSDNVDAKLKKAEQLLGFKEGMIRNVSPASANNLFASGELEASDVELTFLRTDVVTYLEEMMGGGKVVAKITIYRTEIIGGKLVITDEYVFENCYVTEMEGYMGQLTQQKDFQDSVKFKYRWLKRTHTNSIYDQEGSSKGNKVSSFSFPDGQLGTASAG